MFAHNKRLQYTVRVEECNPGLANLMLEQFGGPQGELAAACRYFTQYLAEDDPGRRDMLIDIATEELSHLEVIGTIVAMLNKGAKGRIAEGVLGLQNTLANSPLLEALEQCLQAGQHRASALYVLDRTLFELLSFRHRQIDLELYATTFLDLHVATLTDRVADRDRPGPLL